MRITIYTLLITSTLSASCGPQRRDICDCLSIEAALTDDMLLSQKEIKAKSEGCAWVTEELSPAEQSAKLIECYSKNLPSNSQDTTEKELK